MIAYLQCACTKFHKYVPGDYAQSGLHQSFLNSFQAGLMVPWIFCCNEYTLGGAIQAMDATEISGVDDMGLFCCREDPGADICCCKETKRPSEVLTAASTTGQLFEDFFHANVSRTDAQSGYFVSIDRTETNGSMGIEVGMFPNVDLGDWTTGGLKVYQINRGLVHKWNCSNPGMKVCENDVIVEVNSVKGSCKELLQEMEEKPVLHLHLLRPCDFEREVELTTGWSPPRSPVPFS